MTKRTIATPAAPAAIGPYSQAVLVGVGAVGATSEDGLVFCSGQVPLDPSTGELVGGSIGDQTRRCMENLRAVLDAAGATFDDIVKVTIYVTDMEDFAEINDAYGDFFGDAPPARATVGVAALPKSARVEIECIASISG